MSLEDFIDTLISNCEYLISRGHNTNHLDPYQYSIRKLFKVAVVQKELGRSEFAAEMYAQHLSRISCVSGDATHFNDLMKNIAGEQ